jgi:hypothetical protein
MGYASRLNPNSGGRALPPILATRLSQLRVVVDVQHLYRTPLDRGALYTLPNGTHMHETDATLRYAAALTAWFRARGAAVLTNNDTFVPGIGWFRLVGPYSRRHLDALSWRAHAYIACHLNAGGGNYAAMEYLTPSSAGLALSMVMQLRGDFPVTIPRGVARALVPGDRGGVCVEGMGHLPTVICEPFFGDNVLQQGLFNPPELQAVGESIGEGIARWWEARGAITVA